MNNLIILSNSIRQIDGLYSLNDLHKVAGGEENHKPGRFIQRKRVKDLISEIESVPNMVPAMKTESRGKNQGTFVCRELVYAYAMWISAKFNLAVIRAFDEMQQSQYPAMIEPTESLDSITIRYIDDEATRLAIEYRSQCVGWLRNQARNNNRPYENMVVTPNVPNVSIFPVQGLPPVMRTIFEEKLAQYTGHAYALIRDKLEACAEKAIGDGGHKAPELFDNMTTECQTTFLMDKDIHTLLSATEDLSALLTKFDITLVKACSR